MTRPVSVVLPSLGRTELLEANLPPLFAALDERGLGDEVIVVDDSGEDRVSGWMAERHPRVRVLARERNGGFAQALLDGVKAASHALVFSMNTDVRVQLGFLDPLVACLGEPDVFAVAPRVLLHGDPAKIESWTEIAFRDGLAALRQPGLEGFADKQPFHPAPIAFAVGGTCLFRGEEFLAQDGFDPMYRPFYWEDIDLCWAAWRRGLRVLYQPASTVEHHHRGTIGKVVPSAAVRAAIEKNRYLFQWKFIDEPALLREHVEALLRKAVDAWVGDLRDELVWLCLALDQVEDALAARRTLPSAECSFADTVERARPGTA